METKIIFIDTIIVECYPKELQPPHVMREFLYVKLPKIMNGIGYDITPLVFSCIKEPYRSGNTTYNATLGAVVIYLTSLMEVGRAKELCRKMKETILSGFKECRIYMGERVMGCEN
jgi:hypothetical protein